MFKTVTYWFLFWGVLLSLFEKSLLNLVFSSYINTEKLNLTYRFLLSANYSQPITLYSGIIPTNDFPESVHVLDMSVSVDDPFNSIFL